jgi:hypothetical protein
MNRSLQFVSVVVVLLGLATIASSQNRSLSTTPSAAAPSTTTADSGTAAEREKIWNSPTMLRARAWVQDYCSKSAKITPEEAKEYMTELENLSPKQMKLWLLKFQHEEEMIDQQQAAFEQSRQAAINQAISVNQATQHAYNDINREETLGAEEAQQSINTEQNQAFERGLDKEESLNSHPYGGYGGGWGNPFGYYGGMWPYPAGYAPTHIHVHVHGGGEGGGGKK